MHSLAIALYQRGYQITGSDDEISDPAKSALEAYGLLPAEPGWFPEKIGSGLDGVILGMHARSDNPELIRAMELGIKVFSYPEFLYHETAGKTRVVITGSHGKTTITSLVMHVLREYEYQFDYMVGSRVEGFANLVNLESGSSIAIFEGDEYLASCHDRRPKFLLYQPQIALISGIAWDHINVFPTWEGYLNQFNSLICHLPENGCLIYCREDEVLTRLAEKVNPAVKKIPYSTPDYQADKEGFNITHDGSVYKMQVFGRHNMQNLEGARLICSQLGISDADFYRSAGKFRGAGKRLQLMGQKDNTAVFLDFAYSPSKVEVTVKAVKEQFPERKLIAMLELCTFSSLNKSFLGHYRHTMDHADQAVVYYNPEILKHKRLEDLSRDEVGAAFEKKGLKVMTDKDELEDFLRSTAWDNTVLLLMSSGNFSGLDIQAWSRCILTLA